MNRIEGKTLEEVLNLYSTQKSVDVSDITYEVVEEKKGILGIGSKVVVDVYCSKDIEEFLVQYLDSYFKEMWFREKNDIFEYNISRYSSRIELNKYMKKRN